MDIRRGMAASNGLELAYEDMGDVHHPAIVLIMGLSAQLTFWPLSFCESLVDKGFRVIRFDNRDIGLSTKLSHLRVRGSVWKRMLRGNLGLSSPVPYTLHDMAKDVVGLLDALHIDKAHIVGGSMGGMISQLVAADYPERVASVAIIFSSTNQPFLPMPKPKALMPLLKGPGPKATPDEVKAHSVNFLRTIGSPGFPTSDEELLAQATASYERSFHPAGVVRQFNAVLGTGSLRRHAKRIQAPAVVIHGDQDPLVRPGCGKAVAKAIPNSRWLLIKGMGHDLPAGVLPMLSEAVLSNIARATTA